MFGESETAASEELHLAPGPAAFSTNGNGADIEPDEPSEAPRDPLLARLDRVELSVMLVAAGLAALALALLIASRR